MSRSAPDTSTVDISVAIVSYNTQGLLRACLRSLLAREADGEAKLKIIVADNGSSDRSPDMVRAEFPSVRVIETGENLGFGRANNLALFDASGRAYCLLNSDAELLPGALREALSVLDSDPKIGLVGGQLLWPSGRLQTSYGDDPTLLGVLREQTFMGAQGVAPPIAPQNAAVKDVHQICGAFMLIRPEAWREMGGFDPHYFMYNEDVDLNFRLRRAGWRVVFAPQVQVTHHLGASSSADWRKRARMVSAYNESRFYFFSRFHGPSAGVKLKAYCLLGAAIRLTGWRVLSLVKPSARDKVRLFREVWRRTKALGQTEHKVMNSILRVALFAGVVAGALALVRNKSAAIGLMPGPLKEAVKKNAFYRAGRAALNRGQIARLAAGGELFRPPPSAGEAAQILREWERQGRPLPGPGHFKQTVLLGYAQEFGLNTLIETGTYTGDTPAALKNHFERIYSVELNPELVRRVRERFRSESHISIFHGDSAERLPEILAKVRRPALFWLDSHYSGGITALGNQITPILKELDAILAHPVRGHILLIDDARDFHADKGHPTLNALQAFIADRRPELHFAVEDDIIRITPP